MVVGWKRMRGGEGGKEMGIVEQEGALYLFSLCVLPSTLIPPMNWLYGDEGKNPGGFCSGTVCFCRDILVCRGLVGWLAVVVG